jgi:hypothetical protein
MAPRRVLQVIAIFIFLQPLLGFTQHLNPDGLGGYWVVSGSQVIKLDSEGNRTASYSNLLLGKPSFIDAADPFRIFIFYYESQNLVVLNNDAVIIGMPINLTSLGLGEVVVACRANRGGVWLYHRESNEIVRIDHQLSKVEQRINLSNTFKGNFPNHMVESNGILYIGLANKLIARFDSYGASLQPINISYSKAFRIEGNFVITNVNGIVNKININSPLDRYEKFSCPTPSIPITIKGVLVCFDGERFHFCEKIVD